MSGPPAPMLLTFLCLATLLSAPSVAASTTATPVNDQEQRALIQCVIENQLSSSTCTSVVKNQNNDPNQDLQMACSMLEAGRDSFPLIGCSMADYNKLHKVICEYSGTGTEISCPTTTPPPITAATTTTASAVTDDQKQRELILCVIENQLSNAQCTSVVKVQNTDPNQDLQQACSMLEAGRDSFPLIGCTMADYDKVHKVICEYSGTDTEISCTTTTPKVTTANIATTIATATTTTPRITAAVSAKTEDQKQRELILCVIENQLSNAQCTSVVKAQNTDPNQDLQQACSMLEAGRDSFPLIGCTMADYDRLHKIICEYSGTDTEISCATITSTVTTGNTATTTAITASTTTATASAVTDDQKQRELILCVIDNQLSNAQCTSVVKAQNTDPNQDLQQACSMLEAGRNSFPLIGCTMADYDKLHKVICEYSGTDTEISCTSNTPATLTPTPATTTTDTVSAVTTATTSCISAADIMTDDQKQRALIECVIESDLSSDTCKNAVKAQNNDPNQDLQQACLILESNKNLISVVGCTMDDYDKLHKVICEYQTEEEKQRARVECVINNELSSTRCKDVVKAQNSDPNQDLQQACATLVSFQNTVSLAGCTMDDYDKLHKVICEYNSTGRDIQCTTNTPTTTPLASTTAKTTALPSTITETEQIEKVQAMIKDELSSTQCRDILQSQLTPDLTLERGCELLEQFQSAFPTIGCTMEDYAKLHREVCEFIVDSGMSCDPDLPRWRNEVRDVIDSQLSAQCESMVKAQWNNTVSPRESCRNLLESKDLMMAICTQDDYVSMYDILCRYENRSVMMRKERLSNVLQKVGSSCAVSVNDIVNHAIGGECERITASIGALVYHGFCTRAQVMEIEDNVCNKGSVCEEAPTDPDSRQSRVEASIKDLSENCQRTMRTAIYDLSEPSGKSCKILEERKDNMISLGNCTEVDYVHLYLVVCSDRDSEGDQEIENVVYFLNNNLTASCHDQFWPKVESLAQGLETMCEYLKKTGPTLLRLGDCSQTEYNELNSLLCPTPEDEQEEAQRVEIDRVVAEDVTPGCKPVVEVQIEHHRNKPLEEFCDSIKTSKDLLKSFCTEEDFAKLERAICGGGGDSASALTSSILTIIPLCVMWRMLI